MFFKPCWFCYLTLFLACVKLCTRAELTSSFTLFFPTVLAMSVWEYDALQSPNVKYRTPGTLSIFKGSLEPFLGDD